ncbi:MAG TPA: protein kinase [Vicinamibacteria bacterium]|nr:protein kinase [Vicinamibacteria bacterium]
MTEGPSSATLTARCPGCGVSSSRIPAHLAGKQVRCPRCQTTFKVESPTLPRPQPAATLFEDDLAPPARPAPAATQLSVPSRAPTLSPRSAQPHPSEWRVGEVVLGLYQVTGLLGQGGMGRVYRVRHLGWDVDLAVKAPLPSVLEAVGGADNFEREAETWVNLGLYPHTVVCYYVRRIDGVPRVFAELLDGGSLHDWIARGQLASLPQLLDVAIQFAWGLHYAHEQGLIHRDVKPGNLLLTADGVAKVTDFGLARARPAESAAGGAGPGHTVMVPGGVGGTPAYFSPEQAAGKALTRRSDLWSYALSLLEMFRGGRTWEYGVAGPEVLEGHLKEGGAPGFPAVPPVVVDLLRQSFREDPEDRPRTLWEVALVLKGAYEEATGKRYPRPEPKAVRETADGLSNRAVSLLDLGREAQADPLWNRALKTEPHHLESSYNQTLYQWSQGRLADDEAITRLEEARRTNARAARAPHLLGKLLLALGESDRAQRVSEEATAAGHVVPESEREALSRFDAGTDRLIELKGLVEAGTVLALTPDGGRLVAASGGKDVRVWDAASGRILRTLQAPGTRLRALAISPDARLLLWAGDDIPLEALELASARPVRAFQRLTGFITAMAVTPDAAAVLTGASDRTLRLWELASGRCLKTLEGHGEAVTAVALGGGSTAFSASLDGTVRVWDLIAGASRGVFEGHKGRVLAVAFSEATGTVFSGGEDRSVRQWDAGSGRPLRTLLGHTAPVTALAASDGRLVTAGLDRTVRVWDAERGQIHALFKLEAPVQAIAVAASGSRIWALSGSAVVGLQVPERFRLPGYAVARPVSVAEVEGRDASFLGLLARARQALGGGDLAGALTLAREARAVPGHERSEESLAFWDQLLSRLPKKGLLGAWETTVFEGHRDPVLAVAASPDGSRALSGGMDGSVRTWDLRSRSALSAWGGHGGAVSAVVFTPDGREAVSGSWDKTARLWDAAGRGLRTYEGHDDYVSAVALSPDGRRLLTASWDQTLRLWDKASGRLLGVLDGHTANVSCAAFGPDGRFAVSGGWDAGVRAWDLESFSTVCLLEGHESNVSAVALSPDGRQVASGGVDAVVRVFDLRSRRNVRSFPGHEAEITTVAFTPDGHYLVSAGRDKTVRLWDLRSGGCARILSLTTAVLQVAVTADGSRLVWAGADCAVRVWRLDWEPEPRPLPAWDEKARGHLETFVSLRLKPETRAPAPWNEAEVDALVEDLHRKGFGGLERGTVLGKLQDLTARGAAPSSFWDEVRRTAPRVAPKAVKRGRGWRFRLGVAAGLLALLAVAGFGLLLNRKTPLRLSPYMSEAAEKQRRGLIDLTAFGGDCGQGFQSYLESARAPNVSADTLACLARFAEPSTVQAYFANPAPEAGDARQWAEARRNAISLMVGMGDPVVDELCRALGDPREDVRAVSASGLALMASERSASCLKEAAFSADPATRLALASVLDPFIAVGKLAAPDSLDLVHRLAADPEPAVRALAVKAYAMFDYDHAAPAVTALKKDPDPNVRQVVENTLAHLKTVRMMDLGR